MQRRIRNWGGGEHKENKKNVPDNQTIANTKYVGVFIKHSANFTVQSLLYETCASL